MKRFTLIILLSVLAAGLIYKREGLKERLLGMLPETANTVWVTADPADEGLDGRALDALCEDLAEFETTALLVVRGGRLVHEYYSDGHGPNDRQGMAAMTKAIVAVPALLVCVSDGRLSFDDRITQFVPSLMSDSVRSRILVRHLAFHSSGIENVSFSAARTGNVEGWKIDYYEMPENRFRMALHEAPILFPPGSESSYSGVGYYALAYVLTRSLRGTPESDIRSLYSGRIMTPLEIPDSDWTISYGESYEQDGLTLYACGSGASLTPRAAARVAELMLHRGEWRGEALLDSVQVASVFGPDSTSESGEKIYISDNRGWHINRNGRWPSLPEDAACGLGGQHQVALIVPSLDLVVIRFGKSLLREGETFDGALDRRLFLPVAKAFR